MVDLIEVIVCCCNYEDCKVKDTLDCAGNIDGEIYICDIKKGLDKWLSSFDTASATECFTAVNLLKQRLEGEMEVRE